MTTTLQVNAKRTPKLLADLLEPRLREQTRKRFAVNMRCENDEEAIALVNELRARGWVAKTDRGTSLVTGESFPVARVTSRKAAGQA